VSDDEQTPAPATSSRSRQSLASTSRPSKSKHSRESRDSRPTESIEADLDLPIVSVLSPEDVGKIRVLETETFGLTQKLTSAMSMISDAAVAVEELHVTAANHEVSIPRIQTSVSFVYHSSALATSRDGTLLKCELRYWFRVPRCLGSCSSCVFFVGGTDGRL
jgi:hypothetical protein